HQHHPRRGRRRAARPHLPAGQRAAAIRRQGRRDPQRHLFRPFLGAHEIPGRARPPAVRRSDGQPARGRSPRAAAGPDDGGHLPRAARRNRARQLAGAAPAHLAHAAAQAVAGLENLGGRRPRPGAPPGAMKAAVIGAGWAGLAACAALREAGAQVTVFEAGRTPGGRARRVVHPEFGSQLDNGQHILLGAYDQTLALMRRLGRNPAALLMRRSLRLASLDGRFRLAAPPLPAPWHAAAALLTARGLSWRDRLDAMRLMRGLKKMAWTPPRDWTVAQL